MDRIVVDTDVVSYLFRRDERADMFRPHLIGKRLIISFMTLAELHRWSLARDWGRARKAELEEHIRQFSVYPYSAGLCRTWAQVMDGARRQGRPIHVAGRMDRGDRRASRSPAGNK